MEAVIFNNRLIAEFMGQNIINYNGSEQLIYNDNKYAKTVGENKKLWGGLDVSFTGRFVDRVQHPYDTDFNYLIPIIRRIEEQGFVVCIAGIKYQIYKVMDEKNPIVGLVCGDLSAKTKMVFNLIINFIKWHNEQVKENEFIHENIKYSVWVQDGFKGQQMASVYKDGDRKNAIVGTTFGKMASFKNDIMEWAKKCIAKNFSTKVTSLENYQYSNADLFKDISNHLEADVVHLNKDENINDGEVNYILDVNDTGYNYANKKDRDDDFAAIKKLLK